MFDRTLALEVLRQIHEAAAKILIRSEPIKKVSDFTDCETGMEKMDSICMLLIVIGESLKNLDKITNETLLPQYPEIDWKKAKGMRDILTHHYSDISAEAVFNTCKYKIKPLSNTVNKMIREIRQENF
jgi:uncharacterized protein with HEPN domain